MTLQGHQRRLLLFVAAIIVPALVLVALSLRMLRQERELAEKRLVEEQRRTVNELRQELLARLERIKLQALSTLAARNNKPSTSHTALVLVSWVADNRLQFPWENSRAVEPAPADDPTLARFIQQGEQTELAERQPIKALEWYRQALRRAHQPAQAAYVQLLLARAYAKAGQAGEAKALYLKLLALPAALRDEQGIAFWLYAAERLLLAGHETTTVLERLDTTIEDWPARPPAELYLRRELADRLTTLTTEPALRQRAEAVQRKTADELRQVEQALALQSDLPGLLRIQTSGQTAGQTVGMKTQADPLWFPYGAELWLVSLTPAPGTLQSAAIVVRAQELFAALEAANHATGRAELLLGNGEQGEPLGASFPGLRVSFAARADNALVKRWNLQQAFYVAALLLVLSVTSFGAYLFWRDVRRELHLAELRSQFVSSVSHELKTPLTAIRMFAETLRLGRTTDAQAQAEYLDTIVNESERLTRLLNNVLDFSKIEQGKKTYQLAPISLAEVVRIAARALEYPLAQQGFTLRVEIDDNLPPVESDSDALQQAMLNLLTNAMKYSGASREIVLRLHRQDEWAVIEVEDHGLGIAAQEQERIFEKFYRVQTPETTLIPGTGLGLTLVTHIAKAHGGRVAVQSVLGAGSTFSLYLPLDEDAAGVVRQAARACRGLGNTHDPESPTSSGSLSDGC